ncbi:MAG: prolipoprotein diacylglyceryl transferase [Bdellovibrionales bacterium]|nr:prolipoprotein diacylglyceryl transferase [Bdellovibrionales bacterium]
MFPFIQITEGVLIPSYFLVISLVYVISSLWLFIRAPRYRIPQKMVLDVCLIIMISGFLGARFLHVFYEHPDYYLKVPSQIFKFWQGGFVFYGGLFLALVSSFIYLKKNNQNWRLWFELFAPVVVFGYIVGRFATFLSGSGYGHPTDLPWGIVYPPGPEAPSGVALHPTPIYSMIWNLIYLFFVLLRQKSPPKLFNFPGSFLLGYGVYHGIGRLFIEQFRNDFRGQTMLFLSVSSWISVLLIVICFFIFWREYKNIKN